MYVNVSSIPTLILILLINTYLHIWYTNKRLKASFQLFFSIAFVIQYHQQLDGVRSLSHVRLFDYLPTTSAVSMGLFMKGKGRKDLRVLRLSAFRHFSSSSLIRCDQYFRSHVADAYFRWLARRRRNHEAICGLHALSHSLVYFILKWKRVCCEIFLERNQNVV